MGRKNKSKFKKYKNKCKKSCHSYPQYNYVEQNVRAFKNTAATSFDHESISLKEARNKNDRRIISRKSLYEDPYYFYNDDMLSQQHNYMKQCGIAWDPQKWHRARDDDTFQGYNEMTQKKKKMKQNQLEKSLNKMLAQPVEMSKAERMMEKMGWQGGALGKNGEGITEPIVPNASYATTTLGLGQTTAKQHKVFKENKDYFRNNVLLNVLEFVKNENNIETTFERHLSRGERKCIHMLIEGLDNGANPVESFYYTIEQMDIVQEINKYNQYILGTESEGYGKNRFLCLYKDAPLHVYLITPDDLHQQESDINELEKDKDQINVNKETLQLQNTQHITGTNEDTVEMLLEMIIDYFLEFIGDDNYTEFRFLGPFNHQDMDAIDLFVANIRNNVYGEDDQLKHAYQKIEIKQNANGYTMLHKLKKDSAVVQNVTLKY